MNKETQTHDPQHGSVTSYVVGFILSLVFTIIPYYIVVHESFSKRALIATILVFAVLQMLVQVLFFLHLGREKKPRFNLFFLMSTVSIILLVVVGSLWIMSHLSHGMSVMNVTDKIVAGEAVYQVNGLQAGTCAGGTGHTYKVTIMDDRVMPSRVNARLCDKLIIMNQDDATLNIVYETDGTYAGQPGPSIRKGQNAAIPLTELGTYKFHDKKRNQLSGEFIVTQ